MKQEQLRVEQQNLETSEWLSRTRSLNEISQDLVRCVTFYLHDTGVAELLRSITEDQGQYSLAPTVDAQVQGLLDESHGQCTLGNPIVAQIVENTLLAGDGDHYYLYAWVVHNNHVHVLMELIGVNLNHHIVDNWKSQILRELTQYGMSFIPLWSPGFLVTELGTTEAVEECFAYIEQRHAPLGCLRSSYLYKKTR